MKCYTRPDIYQKVWQDDRCNILRNACRYTTFLMISGWQMTMIWGEVAEAERSKCSTSAFKLSVPIPQRLFTPNKKQCSISSLTLHLNKKLCLYTTRRLTLILASWPAEGVNLIDEDDRWLVLPGKAKKIFHQPGKKLTDRWRKSGSSKPNPYPFGRLLLTSHFLPTIWRRGQRRRWRRRLSCSPLWQQL